MEIGKSLPVYTESPRVVVTPDDKEKSESEPSETEKPERIRERRPSFRFFLKRVESPEPKNKGKSCTEELFEQQDKLNGKLISEATDRVDEIKEGIFFSSISRKFFLSLFELNGAYRYSSRIARRKAINSCKRGILVKEEQAHQMGKKVRKLLA